MVDDPVSEEEQLRDARILQVQGNTNPHVSVASKLAPLFLPTVIIADRHTCCTQVDCDDGGRVLWQLKPRI